MSKKPFSCKIGLHSWYTDSAWFNLVERCNKCPRVSDTKDAEALGYERWLWGKFANEGLDFDEAMPQVARLLIDHRTFGSDERKEDGTET